MVRLNDMPEWEQEYLRKLPCPHIRHGALGHRATAL